jgi:hypothetical protein
MVLLYPAAISPRARQWLNKAGSAQVMHVFKKAINLIDVRGDVLSLVTSSVGPGPFSLVVFQSEEKVKDRIDFARLVDVESAVNIAGAVLTVGSLRVNTSGTDSWQPRPEWSKATPLLKQQTDVLWRLLDENAPPDSMAALLFGRRSEIYHQRAYGAWADLAKGLEFGDNALCRCGSYALAGLGPGLTPAGDDFLLGIIYALHCYSGGYCLHQLVETIKDTAVPRTTRLSAAWLQAGARGEAISGWHSLVNAMANRDAMEIEAAAYQILPTGHTSGADALAGFLAAQKILSESFVA